MELSQFMDPRHPVHPTRLGSMVHAGPAKPPQPNSPGTEPGVPSWRTMGMDLYFMIGSLGL